MIFVIHIWISVLIIFHNPDNKEIQHSDVLDDDHDGGDKDDHDHDLDDDKYHDEDGAMI